MLLDAEVLDIVGEVVLVVVTGKLLLMVVDIGPEADMGVVVRSEVELGVVNYAEVVEELPSDDGVVKLEVEMAVVCKGLGWTLESIQDFIVKISECPDRRDLHLLSSARQTSKPPESLAQLHNRQVVRAQKVTDI